MGEDGAGEKRGFPAITCAVVGGIVLIIVAAPLLLHLAARRNVHDTLMASSYNELDRRTVTLPPSAADLKAVVELWRLFEDGVFDLADLGVALPGPLVWFGTTKIDIDPGDRISMISRIKLKLKSLSSQDFGDQLSAWEAAAASGKLLPAEIEEKTE